MSRLLQVVALLATSAGEAQVYRLPLLSPLVRTQCSTAVATCSTSVGGATPGWPNLCDAAPGQKIATVGDSILVGQYAWDGGVNNPVLPPYSPTSQGVMNSLVSGYNIQSCAVGGSIVNDCSYVIYALNRLDVDVIVWNCGINSILQGNSGATAYGLATPSLDSAITNGKKVVIASVGPCAGYATCNHDQNVIYNGLLQMWCTAQGATRCQFADTNAALAWATDPYFIDPACIVGTDYLHPNYDCTINRYAPVIAAAVRALH